MRSTLLFVAFFTAAVVHADPPRAVEPAQTPRSLLETILRLSRANQYAALKNYLVEAQIGDISMQEIVLQEIRRNDETSSGDYAYSDAGLEKVIEKYGDAFQEDLGDFWKRESDGVKKHAPELKDVPWEKYRLLDQERIHIVVVKVGDTYKLLFWENLNWLIKQAPKK